jgi:hypothetical protein
MSNETEVLLCGYGDGNRARFSLQFQNQRTLVVCTQHKKLVEAKNKSVRCQHCGIPIRSNWKKSALPGFEHLPNCPRSDKVIIELG